MFSVLQPVWLSSWTHHQILLDSSPKAYIFLHHIQEVLGYELKTPTEPGKLSHGYFSKRAGVKKQCLFFLFRGKKKYTSTYKFVAKVIEQVCYYHETPENQRDDGNLCTFGESQ